MNSLLASLSADRLTWLPDLGIGHYPVATGAAPYDAGYWDKYRAMDCTETGEALTAARTALVRKHFGINRRELCDIGIGGGRFVEAMGCFGFDVNPAAVAWLRERVAFVDPHQTACKALTFWDSLEHIADPRPLLAMATDWVFVSLPIFDGPTHVARSKHFRPDEHVWYFTHGGLKAFMHTQGLVCVEANRMEEVHGREDIGTYVFRRVAPSRARAHGDR